MQKIVRLGRALLGQGPPPTPNPDAAEELEALRKELETYKHAFETTAADRDRIEAEHEIAKKQLDDIRAGMAAFAFLNDLNLSVEQVEDRLKNGLLFKGDDLTAARRRASDGLLQLAEWSYRESRLNKTAPQLVAAALDLDESIRDPHHAIRCYFEDEVGPEAYNRFLTRGIARGEWPDAGTLAAQRDAIGRGMPPILLATLPKSGSIYVWSALRETLQIPSFNIASTYSMMDERLAEPLVEIFARGGMIAQHHLPPSPENIEILKRHGVNKVIVHFRDPRQAAVSWWYYAIRIGATRGKLKGVDRDEYLWRVFIEPACRWIINWINVKDIDIYLSTQEKLSGNEYSHIGEILNFIGSGDLDPVLPKKTEDVHFRAGQKDEWLSFFGIQTIERSVDFISPELAERFAWVTPKI